ncbi:LPXTG cell wall anchor domain-containing protein [Lactobacillus mulieris]|uniref:LPXTG cell wall anchor domain-containing protein n=1 Tax=Lactobacillus mulieris TaxID=2508708 RepID=UPI0027E59617|nr:LPXTG cell wall anchor domain-containing protein [Lactobacillus mulieris]
MTIPGEGEKTVEITITRPATATNNSQTNANNSNENKAHNISKVTANKLPQTGENSATLSALGAALVGIAGLGLFLKKKKED